MAIPSSKIELITALDLEYKKLLEELTLIPKDFLREKTLEGTVSVCDILAYQIGWGSLLIAWYEAGLKNINPELPSKNFKWNQLGELAKHFYKVHENDSFESLVKKFKQVVSRIQKIIHENSDRQLYSIGIYIWTGDKWPLGRWINVNTSSPYRSARAKIRKWKKLNKF